jgi:hypothetical protein
MSFVIAQDLDLHSASEDDNEPGVTSRGDDQTDEDEGHEPESPIVLKTMVGFVRGAEPSKNSPSPTSPAVKPIEEDSSTGDLLPRVQVRAPSDYEESQNPTLRRKEITPRHQNRRQTNSTPTRGHGLLMVELCLIVFNL